MNNLHPPIEQLTAYAVERLDPAGSASVEAHLLACATCRRAFTEVMPSDEVGELDELWLGIVDRVDTPRPRFTERILRRVGVPEPSARIIAATPALRLAWVLSVAIVVAAAVVVAYNQHGDPLVFLWCAPLVPLFGVAAAYGAGVDPMFELSAASPMHGSRVLILRTVAVTGASVVILVPATFALPGLEALDAAWILPAFAVSLATLALSTYVPPVTAGGVVAGTWLALVPIALWNLPSSTGSIAAEIVWFEPAGQALFLGLAVVAAVVLFFRRHRLDLIPSHLGSAT